MGNCRETEPDTSATQEGLMQGLDITQKAARIHSGGGRDMLKVWAQKGDHVKSKLHGQRNLVGYSPWGCKGLDMNDKVRTLPFFIIITR